MNIALTKVENLRTAGQLRAHLANQLAGLQNGTVSTEMANTVVRVTDGIANLINAEIKVIQYKRGTEVGSGSMGLTDMLRANTPGDMSMGRQRLDSAYDSACASHIATAAALPKSMRAQGLRDAGFID